MRVKPVVKDGLDWRRPSLIAIPYMVVTVIKRLISHGFVIALPTLFVIRDVLLDNIPLALMGGGVSITLIMILCVIHYVKMSYRVTEESVELRQGVLKKSLINLPFVRIQNIRVEQPIYFRWSGHAKAIFDSAGSSQNEVALIGVSLKTVREIKSIATRIRESSSATCDDYQEPRLVDDQSLELNITRRSIYDIVLHGVSSNYMFVMLALVGAVYGQTQGYVHTFVAQHQVLIDQLLGSYVQAWWQLVLFAVLLIVVVIVISSIFAIVAALTYYYGYQLVKRSGRYVVSSGLVTKYETSMEHTRLQRLVLAQTILGALFKRWDIKLEQIQQYPEANPDTSRRIIIPAMTAEESVLAVNRIFDSQRFSLKGYQRIHARFIMSKTLFLVLPTVIIGGFISAFHGDFILGLATVFTASLILAAIILRWYRWGILVEEDFVYLRHGFVATSYTVLPIAALQQVSYRQNWFMKKHELATLALASGAGTNALPFVPENTANYLLDEILIRIEYGKLGKGGKPF